MKCPNCGAPMSGATCIYCGSTSAAVSSSVPASESSGSEKITWGNRNLLDKILIFLGAFWCIIILVVAVDLAYWRPVEVIAAFLAASPGIVLLLIGFRRKKAKASGEKPARR